jgi:hypothetical protein
MFSSKQFKGISLTLVTCLGAVSINLFSQLPANACGRFDLACKAREQAQRVKEAGYRTQPTYIQTLAVVRLAKRKGVLKGNDCRDLVETGSWAGAGAALASGVATSVAGLVRVVGKDAGNLMCRDAGF